MLTLIVTANKANKTENCGPSVRPWRKRERDASQPSQEYTKMYTDDREGVLKMIALSVGKYVRKENIQIEIPGLQDSMSDMEASEM